MARGQRNIPGLQQRFALKGKLLVTKWKGQTRVSKWPKPYGPPRSQAQADTITAFKKIQRALKFLPPSQTITAMDVTAKTGMYPRDLLMQGMTGTNILLAYDEMGRQAMLGDGLEKFVAAGGETVVSWTNIPTGYSDLEISGLVRGLASGTNQLIGMQFNGDTGGNYDNQEWWNSGFGNNYSQTSGLLADANAGTAQPGYPSPIRCMIPGYANPHFVKSWSSVTNSLRSRVSANTFGIICNGWWIKQDPIARIDIIWPGGFAAGSQLVLRGYF